MRWNLPPGQMPEAWFNVVPHLPEPLQPDLHPGTRQPVGPDDLAPLFPMALIAQEVTPEPWVDIPGEVIDVLRLWRPTPLVRAERLEAELGTPARIYYKDESVSPAGSHKPNTAVPQAFYNKQAGVARLSTETGAGQWGSALAFACALFGLECKVYMVRASYNQKPYRRVMMETWGGSVVPSPVDDPDSPGSLGSAISDAVRDAVVARGHPLLARLGAQPRPLAPDRHRPRGQRAAVTGRGAAPRHRDRIAAAAGRTSEASRSPSCPRPESTCWPSSRRRARRSRRGPSEYDFADVAEMTPLLPMYTLGHEFIPPSIHAGGLRYHGDAPIICDLVKNGQDARRRLPAGQGVRGGGPVSPGPRGRSRRPRRPMPSGRSSTRRWPPRRPARRRSSSSPTRVTGSWTSAPTTTTCTGVSTQAEGRRGRFRHQRARSGSSW